MQRILGSKILMIGVLVLLFLIGLGFIGSMINERQRSYQQVLGDIRRDNVNQQTALTPFIVVPMTTSHICADDAKKTCYYRQQVVISPEKANWKNAMTVDNQRFRRGIYNAISYQNDIQISGSFRVNPELLTPANNQWVDWERAQMRFYLSDLRGLKGQPVLVIGQKKIVFSFPKDEGVNPLKLAYTSANLGGLVQTPAFDFSLNVTVAGTGSFQGLALGNDLSMTMTANWPHPSFYGESLPGKQITGKGFNADWQNTYIANRNTQLLSGCMDNNAASCTELLNAFKRQPLLAGEYGPEGTGDSGAGGYGVNFIQAVDVYLMTERAIKYAALLLVITFGAFFLFEILKDLAIHPMQYSLVGAALAVFYMLLLSFSEHLGFATAYAISSVACISLITFYVSYVLKGVGRSLFFGGVLTTMYGAMFVILQSEDTTLIMGSVLVFFLIAIMMFLTRHVDWYKLGASPVVDGNQS